MVSFYSGNVHCYIELFLAHYFSYRYCKNKPYPKSRFCRGVPGTVMIVRFAFGNDVGFSRP